MLLPPFVSTPEHRLPWILFYPAIFFSGWVGGLVTGLTATLLSILLVGWFILPGHGQVDHYWLLQILLVLLIGSVMSLAFQRYRASVRELRAAQRKLVAESSERARARGSLDRVRHRLQLAADSADIGIWSYDLVTGKTTWDDRMTALFEVPQELRLRGLEHEVFRSRIHPDDLTRVLTRRSRGPQPSNPGGGRTVSVFPAVVSASYRLYVGAHPKLGLQNTPEVISGVNDLLSPIGEQGELADLLAGLGDTDLDIFANWGAGGDLFSGLGGTASDFANLFGSGGDLFSGLGDTTPLGNWVTAQRPTAVPRKGIK